MIIITWAFRMIGLPLVILFLMGRDVCNAGIKALTFVETWLERCSRRED